ncbi:MAG: zinc ribbon domain-containing protein [Ruminococcus sp.]
MYCSKCGAEMKEADEFCYKCGTANTVDVKEETLKPNKPLVEFFRKNKIPLLGGIIGILLVIIVGITGIVIGSIPDAYDRLQCEDIKNQYQIDPYEDIVWHSIDGDDFEIEFSKFWTGRYVDKNFEYNIDSDDTLIITYCDTNESTTYEYAKDLSQIGQSGKWHIENGVLFLGTREFHCYLTKYSENIYY